MAEVVPPKSDIENIFKRLRGIPTNKICFDCNAKNPSWASVTYGVFICIDCSAVHRSLGVHLTFVRSTQLDTNWTWLQLRNMQLGGNANARTFFRQHNCTSTDAQMKYNSRAAQLYKSKLSQMSEQAMKIHGTQVFLDSQNESSTVVAEEAPQVDFFEQHTTNLSQQHSLSNFENDNVNVINRTNVNVNGNLDENVKGPNVSSALNISPSEAQKLQNNKPIKSSIGQRRNPSKLGAKKGGGLGAQRVKTDFSALEKTAERNDQLRKEANNPTIPTTTPVQNTEDQQKTLASLNEVYENLSLNSKREEEKMKKTDPKKAQQAERLGMGLGARTTISHSMFGEMKTIEQTNTTSNTKNNTDSLSSLLGGSGGKSNNYRDQDIDDDFDTIIRFNSGPPKYKDSPFEDRNSSTRGSGLDDLLTSNTNKTSSSTSDWENEFEKIEKPTGISAMSKSSKISASANYNYKTYDETTAQNKFGNAKSISSEMYFQDKDPSSEMKSTLSRFEGSSSISSADLFGQGQSVHRGQNYSSSIQTPDLDDVKESVRQGVTKVAGRLSNMATNVMASLQDRY